MLNTEMKMVLKYLKKNNIVVFLQKATPTIATTTLKQILEYCILLLNLHPTAELSTEFNPDVNHLSGGNHETIIY